MIEPGDQYIIEALKTETEREKVIDPDQSFVESIVPKEFATQKESSSKS